MPKYSLEYTESALEDLAFFRKYEQTLIIDTIDKQLPFEPSVEVRHRKPMDPNVLATWELRIGQYRVFYDIDHPTTTVKIKAVGYKAHSTLYLRGKEYQL